MTPAVDELRGLITAVWNGTISPREQERLEELLANDEAAQDFYLACMALHARLLWQYRGGRGKGDRSSFLGDAWSGIATYFSGHPAVLSYAMAIVIFGLGVLVGSLVQVPRFGAEVAKVKLRSAIQNADLSGEPAGQPARNVGRITGTVDCRWADPRTRAIHGDAVPLARKYVLVSGLVEITYDTGAKVILQGPCAYEVDSQSGGFLSLGRLTALVEKKGSGFGGDVSGAKGERTANLALSQEERNSTASLALRPSSLIPHPSSLFCVRTPTAVVTDLGTEFGVEVNEEGATLSHVFRGAVRVRVVGDDTGRWDALLRAGESAKAPQREGKTVPRLALGDAAGTPPAFVRRLAEPPKLLDVLDIVAGGNGMGHHRERGIDLATGMQDTYFIGQGRDCDARYRRVSWHKLIDGVFVPNGGAGPVQLDSAGHVFAGFPRTSGRTWGGIWARAADVKSAGREEGRDRWVYVMGRREQFTPAGRGLLCLHANAGVTFNLEAVRKSYRGLRPTRLLATAGLAGSDRAMDGGMVDFRAFADGRLLWSREQIVPKDGAFPLDVAIGPNDRFLTLAVTDGGNGITADWFVLGDPVFQMASTEPGASADDGATQVPHGSSNTHEK